MNISLILFYVLTALLPVNLGKHFELNQSYVGGILIDYLVPTVFFQDLLILGILLFWFFEQRKKLHILSFTSDRANQLLVLFLFTLLLSSLAASRFIPSLAFTAHIVLYVSLFFYVKYNFDIKRDLPRLALLSILPFIFVSVLGIAQFFKQASVFNNYLVLGEQPYSVSKWGIDREIFFGKLLVPAYGLFRHPNVFGAYLVVCMMLFIYAYKTSDKRYLYLLPLGVFALFCTLSVSAWLVFLLGIMLLNFFHLDSLRDKKILLGMVSLLCVILLGLPLLKYDNPSLFRRSHLLTAAYTLIPRYPLFGVGAGTFTADFEQFLPKVRDIRFVQPVHNIYVLILAESGIFALILFLSFIYSSALKLLKAPSTYLNKFLLVLLLQLLLLGSFDHYFWTVHQTQILFWMLFGLFHKI